MTTSRTAGFRLSITRRHDRVRNRYRLVVGSGRAELVVGVGHDRVRDGGEVAGMAWGEAGGGPGWCCDQHPFADRTGDERVLDLVAEHVGGLRRADLAEVSRPAPLDPVLDDDAKRQMRRYRLNTRKDALTAELSARWANAIIAGNDAQYRLARDAQHRHIIGLRAAITTIEKRLARPTEDTLTPGQRKERRKAKALKGYATQAERFPKQRRLQRLRAELAACKPTGLTTGYTSSRAENGWLRPVTTCPPLTCPCPRGASNGIAPATASAPTVPAMSRSATSRSPSPRAAKSACGCRNPWSTWPTPHTAATCSLAGQCSHIGPGMARPHYRR